MRRIVPIGAACVMAFWVSTHALAQQRADSPLLGDWVIDTASSSALYAPPAGTTLVFTAEGGVTRLTQRVPGEQSVSQSFVADDTERRLTPDVSAVARMPGANVFELVTTIGGDEYGRARYVASDDGHRIVVTSTTRIPNREVQETVMVFVRQP